MSDFVSDEMRMTVSTIAAGAIVFNALSGEEKPEEKPDEAVKP